MRATADVPGLSSASRTSDTMGSISVREHIRWGSEAPSERTSTLVLTSPRRYFVDIRILSAALQQPRAENSPSRHSLARDQLDWAFGGTSASASALIAQQHGNRASHASFRHWVDSRTTEPEQVVDEGDMFPSQNGTTLETGRMVNPSTGTEMDYEELWRDEEPRPVPAQARCTVFQLHDDSRQQRGLFIQLGQYAQGVLRHGHVLTAERWGWDGSLSRWERLFKAGDEEAPSLEGLLGEAGKNHCEHDTVDTTSGVWTVIETSG